MQVLGLLFSIDDITGFEITKVIQLPKPYGIVFLWGLVLPSLFILANAITSLVFKDALILKVWGPRAELVFCSTCRLTSVVTCGRSDCAACCSCRD